MSGLRDINPPFIGEKFEELFISFNDHQVNSRKGGTAIVPAAG
jgi:hypothetical protein